MKWYLFMEKCGFNYKYRPLWNAVKKYLLDILFWFYIYQKVMEQLFNKLKTIAYSDKYKLSNSSLEVDSPKVASWRHFFNRSPCLRWGHVTCSWIFMSCWWRHVRTLLLKLNCSAIETLDAKADMCNIARYSHL